MTHQEYLAQYADLVVRVGVNIKKDQELVISSPIEGAEFARMMAEAAYKAGAKDVTIHYKDEKFSRIRFTNSALEVFQTQPEWRGESMNHYARIGAAFISIAATDPEIFKGLDGAKLSANNISYRKAIKFFDDTLDRNELQWCVVSVPTPAWAKKVYPGVSEAEAIDKLWAAIFKASRVDTDNPVESWQIHNKTLDEKACFLNEKQFRQFNITNSLGTVLTVGMPDNHIWEGGAGKTVDGQVFVANMPTEEVFTMPHRARVNGRVVSSMPLNYQGNLIEEFSITFKDGRIVDFTAKEGYDALKRLIDTDEGAHYLGELALVPYKSPISDMKTLFYNTLFDENASCHLAIGSAYPTSIKDGTTMTKEELLALGANDSLEHVDFMFGTADLSVIGVDKDGNETPIFKDGNWAI